MERNTVCEVVQNNVVFGRFQRRIIAEPHRVTDLRLVATPKMTPSRVPVQWDLRAMVSGVDVSNHKVDKIAQHMSSSWWTYSIRILIVRQAFDELQKYSQVRIIPPALLIVMSNILTKIFDSFKSKRDSLSYAYSKLLLNLSPK